MPESTARYRFEFQLLAWAEGFSRSLSGCRRAFFVGLREDGSPRRVYVARPDTPMAGERKDQLTQTHPRWFLYSPEDVAGAGYLEWLDVPEETAQVWLGRAFEPADFLDVRGTSDQEGWPQSWRTVFR